MVEKVVEGSEDSGMCGTCLGTCGRVGPGFTRLPNGAISPPSASEPYCDSCRTTFGVTSARPARGEGDDSLQYPQPDGV